MFKNPLHEEFGMWALGFAPYGGADVGEVAAIAPFHRRRGRR